MFAMTYRFHYGIKRFLLCSWWPIAGANQHILADPAMDAESAKVIVQEEGLSFALAPPSILAPTHKRSNHEIPLEKGGFSYGI